MIEVQQDLVGSGLSGGYDGGGPKLIIHTTEGGGTDGPARFAARDLARIRSTHDAILATWRRGAGYPSHLLVTVQLRLAVQCLPFTSPAPTLEDKAGGIRPNRAGAPLLQWEVVGHAAQLEDEWNESDWAWFGALVRQECARHGIPYVFPFPFLSSPSPAYGPTQWGGGAARLDGPTFRDAAGVLGHQHVPENLHSDPGILRLDLMGQALPPPTPGTDPSPTPIGESDMPARFLRSDGAQFILGPNGNDKVPISPAYSDLLGLSGSVLVGPSGDVDAKLNALLDGGSVRDVGGFLSKKVDESTQAVLSAVSRGGSGGASPAQVADELARRLTA